MSSANQGPTLLRQRAEERLAFLTRQRRRRQLQPLAFGPWPAPAGVIDLTNNDYLALRQDTTLQAAIRTRLGRGDLALGAGASRLLGGEHPIFTALERRFAAFKGRESALWFPSGYAANEAVIPTLASLFADGELRVFSDALNHASIIDGIRLAGLPKSHRMIYRHLDLQDLRDQLARSDAALNVIITESIFSMDGDRADLKELAKLAKQHRGILVVDEAHAIFCSGPEGRGLSAAIQDVGSIEPDAMISIDTCGKALAAQGAFICGPAWLTDLMLNTARTFIYTTAPSPLIAAGLELILAQSPAFESRRQRLTGLAHKVREALSSAGLNTGTSTSHIIPVILGADATAMQCASDLEGRGILTRAIRPPTVPANTARLRLSLHAGLSSDDAEKLIHEICRTASGYQARSISC